MQLFKVGQVLTGKTFKSLNRSKRIIKLTTATENHNGVTFKTGMNIDHIKFNPIGTCKPGGFYFCKYDDFHNYLDYTSGFSPNIIKFCINSRNVDIPDDAKVYIEENNKFKTDKFLLSEPIKIYEDHDMCLHIAKNRPHYIKFIKNKTYAICLNAVKVDGTALQHIEEQTHELCMIAVKQSGYALQHVKNQTEEICRLAVEKSCFALECITKQTDEICRIAVQQNGLALKYVKNQTDDLCRLAVQQNGLALKYVKNQTDDLCGLAVQQNGLALAYVINQTEKICSLAVQQTDDALQYVLINNTFKIVSL
jgi:hypothetical protein